MPDQGASAGPLGRRDRGSFGTPPQSIVSIWPSPSGADGSPRRLFLSRALRAFVWPPVFVSCCDISAASGITFAPDSVYFYWMTRCLG